MKMQYRVKEDVEILKVENVSLKFGDKLILRDINISIKDVVRDSSTTGQVVGFLGPSGRGKCFTGDTLVKIKNKKTDEIEEISLFELKKRFPNPDHP